MSWAAAIPIIASIGGAIAQGAFNKRANDKNERLQREFAHNSLSWKMQDAKRAGVHPLFAVGAQTHSASPSHVAGDVAGPMSNMGQDISRAILANKSDQEKQIASLQIANYEADLQGKTIDNQIRASQLRTMNNPVSNSYPSAAGNMIPGQGNTPYKINQAEITASDRNDLAKEAGAVNDYSLGLTSQGGYVPVPSKDMKERIEDQFIQETAWSIRNNLAPNFGKTHKGVPKGYHWNPTSQQYEKGYKGPSTAQEFFTPEPLWKQFYKRYSK